MAAFSHDRLRQSGEIAERMKLALIRKSQARAGIECGIGSVAQLFDSSESRAVRGVELAIKELLILVRRKKEKAIHPLEVTPDLLVADNLLDALNSGRVTLGGETRALLTMQVLNPVVPVVDRIRQVRCRHGRHAVSERAVIDDDYGFPLHRELVCSAEPGDSGADNADIGFPIPLEGIEAWQSRCR
jgi:hypothetical protein